MQVVTEFEHTSRLEPSRIRVHGLAFAEGVRIWLDIQNWKLGEGVERAVPKMTIDFDLAVCGITAKTAKETVCLFPEGIAWSDLPRIAIDSTASIDAVVQLGIESYTEMLAGMALARSARLIVRRMPDGLIRFRLMVEGRKKPIDLHLPRPLIERFLAPSAGGEA